MLAFQIGNEVNPNELASTLAIDRNTVIEYMNILEKFHIIYLLPAFSKFPRKEIAKHKKVFFVDLGIRNILINNFAPMGNRNDFGALFENFVVNHLRWTEFAKSEHSKFYFWRNYQNAEIDLIIEKEGMLTPIEIKYSKMASLPKSFLRSYEEEITSFYCINRENFWKYL